MKTQILISSSFCVAILSIIVFASFKYQENGLFYCAFKEKIFLETVPGKNVVRYGNKNVAKTEFAGLQKQRTIRTNEYKDERTAIINMPQANASIATRELQNQQDVVSLQPLYLSGKDKLEMASTNEILIKLIVMQLGPILRRL